MGLQLIVTLVCHLAFTLGVDAFGHNISTSHGNGYNLSSLANITTNGTLVAGYYRNVSAGAAWVAPASPFDLGARAMACECFDPDENCCMPSSHDVAPFCIPTNATCCANTFCAAGETCCGNYCCRSDTTCSTNSSKPGCCPRGQSCNDQDVPICLDHSYSNCTNTFFPPKQCCPASLPYSRAVGSAGCGCFGALASASVGPKLTPQPSIATTSHNGTTTLVETISVKFISSSALSLQFPETLTLPSNLAGWSIVTAYVFSFPSTIFHTSTSSPTTTKTTSSTSSSSSSSPSSSSTSTSTSTPSKKPTLCFDPDLQSPVPCTSPGSIPPSSPASPSYPAETTLHSSAPRTMHAWNIYYLLSSLALIYLFVHVEDFTYRLYVAALWILNGALRAWTMYRTHQVRKHGDDEGVGGIYDVVQANWKSITEQMGEIVSYAVVMPFMVGCGVVRKIGEDWAS